MEYAINKIIMAFFTLASPCLFTGCSRANEKGINDTKPIYVNLIPPAFQGEWVKDTANCSNKFGDYQINIFEDQIVFKTKSATPSKLQLAGRALYIDANVNTENGVKKEKYELIVSANGKTLVSSDGIERFKCAVG